MELHLQAGFDACRSFPPGQGLQSHTVDGFGIFLLSNHDADDTFLVRIVALFIPGDRGIMTWRSVSEDVALRIIAAVIGFSESHFGHSVLDDVDRELVDEINSFLSSGN